MTPQKQTESAAAARAGVAYGVAGFAFWGLVPIYFKAVKSVPPLEVLAHRIIWAVLLLGTLVLLRRNWRTTVGALRSRRVLLTLLTTTALIAINWFGFIWAVANNIVLQASLGYFINPLVSVLLGFVFLRERLRRWQKFSVLLAAAGVLYLTIAGGELPGMALLLAGSFGFYGLLRKTAPVQTLAGLSIETAFLTPPALAYMVYHMIHGTAVFGRGSLGMDLLLMAAGVITALPLLWFNAAARRLRLATLGFLQYLAPTGQFLLAVLAYGEPFTHVHLVTFACIWVALGIYSVDTLRGVRASAVP